MALKRTSNIVSESKYVIEILERAHMLNCNPFKSRVATKSKIGADGNCVEDLSVMILQTASIRNLLRASCAATLVYSDNVSVVHLSSNRQTRFEIDVHFVGDLVSTELRSSLSVRPPTAPSGGFFAGRRVDVRGVDIHNQSQFFAGRRVDSPTCVNFLRWYDSPMCQRSVQIIPGLLRSRNELEEIVAMVEEKRRKLLKFLIISWVVFGFYVYCTIFVHLEELMQMQREAQQANELSNLRRQRQLLASVNYRRAIIEELEHLPRNLVTYKTREHLKHSNGCFG
ncbi:hypothetical protein Tco_0627513 [Tanacetum coccineum]|uniref:Zinc finger, GRF-type n=1 Tax=Tanacetum coccineum TaxID=301880 RepID=A0ABQ4WNG3_9ASTR